MTRYELQNYWIRVKEKYEMEGNEDIVDLIDQFLDMLDEME